jgi:Leucine-rich repeat (LRR) protein
MGAFHNFTNLQALTLTRNRLNVVKAGLPKLKKLFLDNNKIVILKLQTFNGFWSLLQLELGNNMTISCNALEGLDSLRVFYLKYNRLLPFPKECSSHEDKM